MLSHPAMLPWLVKRAMIHGKPHVLIILCSPRQRTCQKPADVLHAYLCTVRRKRILPGRFFKASAGFKGPGPDLTGLRGRSADADAPLVQAALQLSMGSKNPLTGT